MKQAEKAARLVAVAEVFADQFRTFGNPAIHVRNAIYGLSERQKAHLYDLIKEDA